MNTNTLVKEFKEIYIQLKDQLRYIKQISRMIEMLDKRLKAVETKVNQ